MSLAASEKVDFMSMGREDDMVEVELGPFAFLTRRQPGDALPHPPNGLAHHDLASRRVERHEAGSKQRQAEEAELRGAQW